MRFMIIVKANQDTEAGVMPEDKLIAAMAEYHLNLHLAQFKPLPPEALQLRAALRRNGDQEDINCYYLAERGLIPRETFFNPDTLRRILAAA